MSQELFFVLAYLMGAFPSSFVIGKYIYSINLLEHGSKNLGATNAFRVLGKTAGLWVLFLDILKGFIPVVIATKLWPDSLISSATAGIIAVLGHSFSIFVKFKGGKGVATSTGVFLALAPKALLLSLFSFLWLWQAQVTSVLAPLLAQSACLWLCTCLRMAGKYSCPLLLPSLALSYLNIAVTWYASGVAKRVDFNGRKAKHSDSGGWKLGQHLCQTSLR